MKITVSGENQNLSHDTLQKITDDMGGYLRAITLDFQPVEDPEPAAKKPDRDDPPEAIGYTPTPDKLDTDALYFPVWSVMASNPDKWFTSKELAELTAYTQTQASYHVGHLVKMGHADRERDTRKSTRTRSIYRIRHVSTDWDRYEPTDGI